MSLQPLSKVSSGANLSPSERRQYKVICAALWCYYHKDQISYSALRGSAFLKECKIPPYVPSALDCSGFVTYCYKISNCPDPNGKGYDGQTHTGILWANGKIIGDINVKEGALEPGDLIFYANDGPLHGGNSEHVSIYIDEGMVVSMGNEEGPSVIDYKDEKKPIFGARRYAF
jgi:cell wall-associated NlpC family hydrolase